MNHNLITIYFIYVTVPMVSGFLLDYFFGDPLSRFHPVVIIGRMIRIFDRKLRRGNGMDYYTGVLTAALIAVLSALVPGVLLYLLHRAAGWIPACAAASLFCWQMIAARDLVEESMKVFYALEAGEIPEARLAVSMIVGRDTDRLDREGIIRATVETVAENTSDGVTAPLFFMALFGIPGMYFYKAVNTMDSMIGYKNEKYLLFGRAAAKLDDFLNFLPARATALLMIAAAALLPGFDGRAAAAVFARDRKKSTSPNAGCTEACVAGALHIRLLGPACYFGELIDKPYIGDDDRKPETEDIRRACRLMYRTSVLTLLVLLAASLLLMLTAGNAYPQPLVSILSF